MGQSYLFPLIAANATAMKTIIVSPMTTDSTGKGRPTPKRKVSEAKRITSSLAPVVTKDQKRAAKLQSRQDRMTSRAAYLRGEENALPARDRGPERRFVRNYVDARRSIGEYFLPIIFIVLILTLIPEPAVQFGAIAIMYGVLMIAVVDGIFLSRKIRRLMGEKFPKSPTKGLGMYAWLRSTQMRRLRAPHPQIKVGETFN
jgi:hypothetical protein